MKGFLVMSYQANLASNHTGNGHVSVPIRTVWYWKTQQNVLLLFIYFIPHYQITTE